MNVFDVCKESQVNGATYDETGLPLSFIDIIIGMGGVSVIGISSTQPCDDVSAFTRNSITQFERSGQDANPYEPK